MTSKRQRIGALSYARGLWAEQFAELILRLKGYRILGRRIKTPLGEIDLLVAKQKTLIVVEVKQRRDGFLAGAAIAPTQQTRLRAAASYILHQHQGFETLRFDAILLTPRTFPKHVKNAFF